MDTYELAKDDNATTTIFVRGLQTDAATLIKRAAMARGMTLGQYLSRLAYLHLEARTLANTGDGRVRDLLEDLGLATVTG